MREDSVAPTLPPPGPPPRGKRIIAVGGGRGGVGKSTLTVNLAVYFAQLGRSVVVCDADPVGSNLHAMLGLAGAPLVPFSADEPASPKPVTTRVPGLSMLPTTFDLIALAPVRPTRKTQWAARIAEIEADYVLVHLGGSVTPSSLDLFATADVSVCVTAPDPLAVEASYGFLRALFARGLRRRLMKEKHKLKLTERALSSLPPQASPIDIVEAIHRYDHVLGRVAQHELARLSPRLVVGQTRLRSDLELGPAMSAISERFLGIALEYLAHIEHDDAVWLAVRKQSPLLIESPTSKSARNIERVARRILALVMAFEARRAQGGSRTSDVPLAEWLRPAPATLYEVLGVARTASDDEIRRAYKRQRDVFRDGSFPAASVVSDRELRAEQARIEQAYDTLLDPNKRRSYDLSTFPAQAKEERQIRHVDSARAAELALLQAEVAREIHAETQFTGSLLRKVRESQGVDVADIAVRTKISGAHIRAIEAENPADLPAMVYVQGFVQEIAKFLKLDPTQVSRTLVRRLREIVARQGGGDE